MLHIAIFLLEKFFCCCRKKDTRDPRFFFFTHVKSVNLTFYYCILLPKSSCPKPTQNTHITAHTYIHKVHRPLNAKPSSPSQGWSPSSPAPFLVYHSSSSSSSSNHVRAPHHPPAQGMCTCMCACKRTLHLLRPSTHNHNTHTHISQTDMARLEPRQPRESHARRTLTS